MDATTLELNAKLDALTAQVTYLTEQAQSAERQRQERNELLQDMLPAVNGMYNLTVAQLDEVKEYVDLDDLLRLLKRLLRNRPVIEQMLDQLESLSDLLDTVSPISNGAYDKAVTMLQMLEHKGYFTFARGSAQIADTIVTSFGEEEIRKLGENIVLILNTVKEMTQPEIMGFVRTFVRNVELEVEKPVNISLGALLGQMRDPNTRKGLAITMRVLRVLGAQAA